MAVFWVFWCPVLIHVTFLVTNNGFIDCSCFRVAQGYRDMMNMKSTLINKIFMRLFISLSHIINCWALIDSPLDSQYSYRFFTHKSSNPSGWPASTLKQIKRERTVYLFQSALCQHCLISQDAETEKHQHTAQSWVISIRHMNRDVLYFGVDENCILHFQQYYQGCCSV